MDNKTMVNFMDYLKENYESKDTFSSNWDFIMEKEDGAENNNVSDFISLLFEEGCINYYNWIVCNDDSYMSNDQYGEEMKSENLQYFLQDGQHQASELVEEFCDKNNIYYCKFVDYIIDNYKTTILNYLIKNEDLILNNINEKED